MRSTQRKQVLHKLPLLALRAGPGNLVSPPPPEVRANLVVLRIVEQL